MSTASVSAVLLSLLLCCMCCHLATANPDAKRLYDDLLKKKKYNPLMRPVEDHTHNLTVKIDLKLSQLIDVDEKNEIITTNVWLLQEWTDSSLKWDPRYYGEVDTLYVPSKDIWRPDIVLYNNADGDYIITMLTKATIEYTGVVKWQPPAIYKSQCDINVEFFPFDEQECKMKFGVWTYSGDLVDMRHRKTEEDQLAVIDDGMDLSSYYPSVEWDLMEVWAQKTENKYPCCEEPYPDVTFHFTIRRKILYYTINLIIPCVSINIMTLLVFYLPADCGEKISICISIMLSLSLFQLLLMELVPGTSIVTPLIGKYLLFTCILVSMSVITSVFVLNLTQRSSSTHTMPSFVRRVFVDSLPRLLCMQRPVEAQRADVDFSQAHSELLPFDNPYKKPTTHPKYDSTAAASSANAELGMSGGAGGLDGPCDACAKRRLHRYPPNVHKALDGVVFIANHLASADDSRRVSDDWKFLSKVVDRILLYIYITVCFVGGAAVMMSAPSLYDTSKPLQTGSSQSHVATDSVSSDKPCPQCPFKAQ